MTTSTGKTIVVITIITKIAILYYNGNNKTIVHQQLRIRMCIGQSSFNTLAIGLTSQHHNHPGFGWLLGIVICENRERTTPTFKDILKYIKK